MRGSVLLSYGGWGVAVCWVDILGVVATSGALEAVSWASFQVVVEAYAYLKQKYMCL